MIDSETEHIPYQPTSLFRTSQLLTHLVQGTDHLTAVREKMLPAEVYADSQKMTQMS